MAAFQIPLKSNRASYTLKNAVKPNVGPSVKALGFTRFLFDVAYMEKLDFPMASQRFDGVRSTQPTMQTLLKAKIWCDYVEN